MSEEQLSVEQLLAQYDEVSTYIDKAKAHQQGLLEEISKHFTVKDGQDSQTFNKGDFKIVKSEAVKYSLNSKAYSSLTDEQKAQIPEGVVSIKETATLSAKRMKEELESNAEAIMPILTSKTENKVTITKKGE